MWKKGAVNPMMEWSRGISKRRQDRIRAIREGKGLPGGGSGFRHRSQPKEPVGKWDELPWNRPGVWGKEGRRKRESRLVMQTFFAFFLMTGTWLIFQSDAPSAKQAQSFISEVMNRDYNFQGVARWYEENIGGAPAILPAFREDRGKGDKKDSSWVAPVKGSLVQPFKKGERGVVIRTQPGSPVVAAAEGWVVETGEQEGLGKTVVLRHADGKETWYGWLKEIRVKKKDWVQPRQLVGEVGGRAGDPLLFFALRQGGDFVNPAGVVAFE